MGILEGGKRKGRFYLNVNNISRAMLVLAFCLFLLALLLHFSFYFFFVNGLEVLSFYEITFEQVLCFVPLILIIAGGACVFGLLFLLLI